MAGLGAAGAGTLVRWFMGKKFEEEIKNLRDKIERLESRPDPDQSPRSIKPSRTQPLPAKDTSDIKRLYDIVQDQTTVTANELVRPYIGKPIEVSGHVKT